MTSALPPLRVDPGWYWWLIMPQDQKDFAAFRAANKPPAMAVRKVLRGQNEVNEIVVFEVKTPIAWTLPVPPMRAPKGIKTNIDDLIKGPPPSPHWSVALEEFFDKPMAKVREASSALSLVLWGGAAILLFNLFRHTRAETPDPEEA